jgi:hypothetical protein
MKIRLQVRLLANVSDKTLCRWALGDQTVDEHRCRSIVLALQGMGMIPPGGAKLPPAQPVVVGAGALPLRAVS